MVTVKKNNYNIITVGITLNGKLHNSFDEFFRYDFIYFVILFQALKFKSDIEKCNNISKHL